MPFPANPANNRDWETLRYQFETGALTLRAFAKEHNLPTATLFRRAARGKWKRQVIQIAGAREAVTQRTITAIEAAGSKIESEVVAMGNLVLADLAPWIESEKRKQVIRAVKRAVEHQERIDSVALTVEDPKGMAMIATAEDKFDAIIRRNLGMSEGTGIGGSLNINILANQASITTAEPNE